MLYREVLLAQKAIEGGNVTCRMLVEIWQATAPSNAEYDVFQTKVR